MYEEANGQQTGIKAPLSKLKNIGTAGTIAVGLAILFFSVVAAQAFISGESIHQKVSRLEAAHKAQVGIIENTYSTLEKATKVLKNIELELSSAKSERELQEENPNYAEVNRLSQKVNDLSGQLGN